jgi:Uma2 family endonuclease
MTEFVAPPLPARIEDRLITGEEAMALGDIGPFEIIDGRLVFMSPVGRPHALIGSRLDRILGGYVHDHQLGEVYVGEIGIWIRRNPDTARAADLAFVAAARLAKLSREGYLNIAPDLVIEIMSPDDRWSEVKKKLRDYFSIGVKLAWVIDAETRTVTTYRSSADVREYTEDQTLTAEDILPGFALPVQQIFE